MDEGRKLEEEVGDGLHGGLHQVGLEVDGLLGHPVLEVLLDDGRLAVDDGEAEGRQAARGGQGQQLPALEYL